MVEKEIGLLRKVGKAKRKRKKRVSQAMAISNGDGSNNGEGQRGSWGGKGLNWNSDFCGFILLGDGNLQRIRKGRKRMVREKSSLFSFLSFFLVA